PHHHPRNVRNQSGHRLNVDDLLRGHRRRHMRVGIMGASGRVGLKLVEAVLADPGQELAAAFVSPQSRLLGTPVANGSIEYRAADADFRSYCDVVIDFSNPAASLQLQEISARLALPMVIGTTGFTPAQQARLEGHARHRALLISP